MSGAPNRSYERPAVFFMNGLGDQLIALPAMRALNTLFPDGIQLLLGKGLPSFVFRGLAAGEPAVVPWLDFNNQTIDVDRIVSQCRPCDLFVSLSTWTAPSVAELARQLGASRSIGFFEMFDDFVPVQASAHMFDWLFSLPQRLSPGLCFDDFTFTPRFSTEAEEAARRFVDEQLEPGERLLLVHPETRPEKMWPAAAFSHVLECFLAAHPEFRVVVLSLKPYPLDLPRHGGRVVSLVAPPLERAFAMMRHADLFLGLDSCFLHLADLFRVPGIGLFGPSDPRQWGFRLSPWAISISGRGSMEAIRPEQVLDALLELAATQTQVSSGQCSS